MKTDAVTSSGTNRNGHRQIHASIFAKAVDGRKQPIRGLWIRNARFYARLAVEDANTGRKAVRRVPLLDTDAQPVHSVARAVAAMERLRTQRADDNLPQLGQTPPFAAYATKCGQSAPISVRCVRLRRIPISAN